VVVADALGKEAPLLVGWGALALLGLLPLWRVRGRWLVQVTQGLNVVAGLAVLINVIPLGAHVVEQAAVPQIVPPGPSNAVNGEPERRPDIYYIIPDRYGGLASLAEGFGFDNEPFYRALEERGFTVARDAHANYMKTPLSLVSSLSMDYLDQEELQAEQTDAEDRRPIHRRLQDHLAVPLWLKQLGYEYVHIANWWEPSSTNVDADRIYRYEGDSEFTTTFWRTTMMRVFDPETPPLESGSWPLLRAYTEVELDALDRAPDLGEPKFVFAHLLLPHNPYMFDRDGSYMDEEQVAEQGLHDSFIRQLQFTNDRLLGIIDNIIARSDEPPVILLQADEGPFPDRYVVNDLNFDWHGATPGELEEKSGILSAFYLPGVDAAAAGVHPSITPVNSFRIVFNEYFGGTLPLLPDRSYAHTSQRDFFDFFEITDIVARDGG
jgi:hypothetical protein